MSNEYISSEHLYSDDVAHNSLRRLFQEAESK